MTPVNKTKIENVYRLYVVILLAGMSVFSGATFFFVKDFVNDIKQDRKENQYYHSQVRLHGRNINELNIATFGSGKRSRLDE